MITKLRPRYYCEHCRKSAASASSMASHEKACTANPRRECNHCPLAGAVQQPIGDLLAALDEDIAANDRAANVKDSTGWHYDGRIKIPRLTALAENCPVHSVSGSVPGKL